METQATIPLLEETGAGAKTWSTFLTCKLDFTLHFKKGEAYPFSSQNSFVGIEMYSWNKYN